MDLVIIIVILAIVVLIFKKFSSFVYFTVFIDLFLRILYQLSAMIGIAEISEFVSKYFPSSIPGILSKYSFGIFLTILMWGYIIIYIIFEVYIIKTFMKKK